MVDYPPYVHAYGQIHKLFEKIKVATVPTKFTQDFLVSVLELKSTSHRPLIPFLKRLGFINEAQVPTSDYNEYRDDTKSGSIMARRVKEAYKVLFEANEYAYKLPKEELISKLNSRLGTGKEDKVIPLVAASFKELCKLADFESKKGETKESEETPIKEEKLPSSDKTRRASEFGISYTINLNLPATKDSEVFDAIFKSLKENLLK